MRKITPKQYAQGLYEASQDHQGDELRIIFDNFLKLIWKNKDWKNLDKILRSFKKVYQQNKGLVEAKVASARHLSAELKNQIKDWLKKNENQSVFLEEEIDETLLGGWVLRYEDTVYDLSLKNLISNLQKELNR
ncbi:MAG: ATP synthase F1 subunit delta [Candidatus Komeilibacteria bacterium RIFCSPLOWO2_01_FULL_45_10]|uniref:ATP synthase subunit delta n=1 Tax=Candidatus Komeilibacteria bacterium RIFCSPLOWO2_01_FULL_45_10 TaxID=1798550 RepID=A0A1G2BJ53_9BACT|nr:MAG: ATP synthase F1 subunit delta [Candidatus Komeilibacteria bacterium RIFCSPLOWO2_01_FULL_45_10]